MSSKDLHEEGCLQLKTFRNTRICKDERIVFFTLLFLWCTLIRFAPRTVKYQQLEFPPQLKPLIIIRAAKGAEAGLSSKQPTRECIKTMQGKFKL